MEQIRDVPFQGTIHYLLFYSLILETSVTSVNYGIVIDAGSSSSKVYLFQWPPHDGDPSKLLKIMPLTDELDDPLTSKVEPGERERGTERERERVVQCSIIQESQHLLMSPRKPLSLSYLSWNLPEATFLFRSITTPPSTSCAPLV